MNRWIGVVTAEFDTFSIILWYVETKGMEQYSQQNGNNIDSCKVIVTNDIRSVTCAWNFAVV